MPQTREIASAAAEVILDPHIGGTCAVYIIEVRNRQELREVKELFTGLDEIQTRQLAEGTVTAYAVRVPGPDLHILDEIELVLKENYRFSISERSFQKTIYTVVRDLCQASDSMFRPVPTCGICQAPDPFATTITFLDAEGSRLAQGAYCAKCAASVGTLEDRELVSSLLSADKTGLAPLGRLRLTEPPRRAEGNGRRYHYEDEGPRAAAAS